MSVQVYYRLTPVQKEGFLLGTYIRITAYGPRAKRAVEQAMAKMEEVEEYTASDTGPVDLINQNAGIKPVQVNQELFSLIQRVLEYSIATGGRFDPTIGPLVELWGFGYNGTGRLPAAHEITTVLPLVNRDLVVLDEEAQTVFLTKKGMLLDLGGVAKGYAVDQAWEVLAADWVWGALINGGESSIRVLGTRPNFGPWRIGVAHPRNEGWIGVINLPPAKAISTSADTQRFFEWEGRRYSHLINPISGYPGHDLFSATVIADSAFVADLYSTAVFVAEKTNRVKLLNQWQVEGVVTDAKGEIHYTPGMKSLFR
jgi:thiamine biosynthesis lipoprotein